MLLSLCRCMLILFQPMSYGWIVDTPYRSDSHSRCYLSCSLRTLPGSSTSISNFPHRFRVQSRSSNPMIAAKCDVPALVEEGCKRKEFRFLAKLLADYITERVWDDDYSLRETLVKKGSWVAAPGRIVWTAELFKFITVLWHFQCKACGRIRCLEARLLAMFQTLVRPPNYLVFSFKTSK